MSAPLGFDDESTMHFLITHRVSPFSMNRLLRHRPQAWASPIWRCVRRLHLKVGDESSLIQSSGFLGKKSDGSSGITSPFFYGERRKEKKRPQNLPRGAKSSAPTADVGVADLAPRARLRPRPRFFDSPLLPAGKKTSFQFFKIRYDKIR